MGMSSAGDRVSSDGIVRRFASSRAAVVALVALVFVSVYPTLRWMQFHQSLENLNLATAMEMKRGGDWLVPTLQGIPRLAKPPLTAWITTLAIRDDTFARLDAPEKADWQEAYHVLATETRWPTLLAMCALLLATYELARAAASRPDGAGSAHRVGLISIAVACTTFFFARHSRLTSTDVYLALWVTVANAALVRALFLGRYRFALPVAGIALGLALMAKGPVSLLQSVVPFAVFVWLGRSHLRGDMGMHSCPWSGERRHGHEYMPMPPQRRWLLPMIVGVVLMLAVGLWWYVLVALNHPNVADLWWTEVSRRDADGVPAGPWYNHFVNLGQFGVWIGWLAMGAGLAISDLRRRQASTAVLALLMLAVPVLVMSFAKDRFDRYLLPMLPAGALLAALAIDRLWSAAKADRADRTLLVLHYAALVAWCIVVPIIAATTKMKAFLAATGEPWFTWPQAIAIAAASAAVIATAAVMQRRLPAAAVVSAFLVVTAFGVPYAYGQARSGSSQADFLLAAEVMRERYPDAALYARRRPKRNEININANALSIYLNRPAKWAPDAETMAREPGTVAWVIGVPKRNPDPPVPPGWKVVFHSVGSDKKVVMVRER